MKLKYPPLLLLSICLILSSPSMAESPYPFSRLFTTNAERIYLDDLKNQIKKSNHDNSNTLENNKNIKTPNTKSTGSVLRLSGFIKRSDGQQQVWVNEKKLINSDYLSGKLSSSNKPTIKLRTKEKQTFIKVGQSWDPPKDEIIHVYKKK